LRFIKEKRTLVLCVFAAILGVIACISMFAKKDKISGNELMRPGYDDTAYTQQLNVYAQGEDEPYSVEIEVNPQQYGAEEITALFEELYEKVKSGLAGENESLSKVTEALVLPKQIDGYPVAVEWYSSDYTVVDYDGTVYNAGFTSGECREIDLTCILTYGQYRGEYIFNVVVCEPVYATHEERQKAVQEQLQQAESQNYTDSSVKLPDTINGVSVTYEYAEDKTSPFILLGLFILAIVLVRLKGYEQKRKKSRERTEQLQYDYSEVISKLTLLTGAGMTVRRAWEKMAYDYQNNSSGQVRYVYEEMLKTCNELQSGISERAAYERFGKRCNTKEYIKLSSLLAQNVKKGTNDIIRLLEQEASSAFFEHKNLARKKGEEAGTRLLIPMIMMLAIVMIIVLFPAMTSFTF
jgi:hypothetical protein